MHAHLTVVVEQVGSEMNYSMGELFYALEEARFMVERWEQAYNQFRPTVACAMSHELQWLLSHTPCVRDYQIKWPNNLGGG